MAASQVDSRIVTITAPDTFAAERYQGLRLKLDQARQQNGRRVIAITSPGAGDGKTLTSVNLAGVLARESDTRVLLVDADLRRSSVGPLIGIAPGSEGLAELVAGSKRALKDLVQRPDGCGFDVLPAGATPRSVQQLFRSARFAEVLDEARGRYDYVLLDTAPIVPVFDAAVLSRKVDGVIVVVAADRTPRKMLAAALDLLEPASVIGLVFNNESSPLFGYNSSAYRPYFTPASARS